MSKVRIVIGWFTPEQWPEVQRIMEDKATETYEQWLDHARDFEAKAKKEGLEFLWHPVDLDDFSIWCKRKERKLDAAARAAYVADKARK